MSTWETWDLVGALAIVVVAGEIVVVLLAWCALRLLARHAHDEGGE